MGELQLLSFLSEEKVYSSNEIFEVLERVKPFTQWKKTNKKIEYCLLPCSFDTETSSFYDGETKVAIMYEWSFCIYGLVVVGRTWEEFLKVVRAITVEFSLWENRRLIIYVHNLGYDFQFMRKYFDWVKVFSIEQRKPIYAITSDGLEFRCSYLLSGSSLEKIGNDLRVYKVKKMVGDLNYKLVRHSETPLTEKELGYCVNDVKVVVAYIQEASESAGGLLKLPLTKTGYVRNFCRSKCFGETYKRNNYKRLRYRDLITSMTLKPDEYRQLKRAFQGGFTHANPFYSGKVIENVTSFDFTSSYPCVMLAEKFPMSSSETVEIKDRETFDRNLKHYCCLFDIEFRNLQSKVFYENYISISRCWGAVKAVVNNGRVVSADVLHATITEQDYMVISAMYSWDCIAITNFKRYIKGYLPTDFVKAILSLYEKKTTLKGVEGKEVEYLQGKEMLNSCYGMAVTDIVRDEIIYSNGEWGTELSNDEREIEKYNKGASRFLFYPWGVWVTAYARKNLFTGILEFKQDYIYSDTDSIKVKNAEQHRGYIERYNKIITEQLARAMKFHGIPIEATAPKTIKGKSKPLGVWDFDGHYSKFKTLGAKRYMVEYSDDERNNSWDVGKISITVSGVNKKLAVPYLLETYGKENVFDVFKDGIYFPPGKSGKTTHTYIDKTRSGTVIDYTGKPYNYCELSGIHLEEADYTLTLAREYVDYISGITLSARAEK